MTLLTFRCFESDCEDGMAVTHLVCACARAHARVQQ